MARLESFPDRLTLERYAREMRAKELDRVVNRCVIALRGFVRSMLSGTAPRAPRQTLHPQ